MKYTQPRCPECGQPPEVEILQGLIAQDVVLSDDGEIEHGGWSALPDTFEPHTSDDSRPGAMALECCHMHRWETTYA